MQRKKYKNIEDSLEYVTYNALYMICEMIDGYGFDLVKYNFINLNKNTVVNDNIELHDWCEKYLRYPDI